MTFNTFSARHVRARIRSGSSSPVVVQTEGGRFVVKLRGAAQGPLALVAEIIVAELAERLGLSVPERVLIDLLPDFESDDRNDELADLLRASIGLNLGFRWLEGAREPRPEHLAALDDDFKTSVLWLDGLTLNPDRSTRNPNILLWHRRPWLIDHGAALTFQHDWRSVREESPREPAWYAGHVFESSVASLPRLDAELAAALSRDVLERAIAKVPDAFLSGPTPDADVSRTRAAYQAFLWKRLEPPRPFVSA